MSLAGIAALALALAACGGEEVTTAESERAARGVAEQVPAIGERLYADPDALVARRDDVAVAAASPSGRELLHAAVDEQRISELQAVLDDDLRDPVRHQRIRIVLQRWVEVQGFVDGAAVVADDRAGDDDEELEEDRRLGSSTARIATALALVELDIVPRDEVPDQLLRDGEPVVLEDLDEDELGNAHQAAENVANGNLTYQDVVMAHERGFDQALE